MCFLFLSAIYYIIWSISDSAVFKCVHITDPERFRFARDTTFGRRHLNPWSQSTISLWIVSTNLFDINNYANQVPKTSLLAKNFEFKVFN